MKKSYGLRARFDLLLLLVTLPLIGVVASGKSIAAYLEFPPLTRYVQHAGFSWPVFIGLAIVIVSVIIPFILRVLRSRCHAYLCESSADHEPSTLLREPTSPRLCRSRGFGGQAINHQPSTTNHSPFPWWGWAGLGLAGITWFMAWTRCAWFAPLQAFTFTPIWAGYVLVVNGLTYKRTGHCILRNRPGYLLRLFIISAVFWWYFEYLNRFVQNWHYVRIGELSHVQYFLFATLPFSTVLPAVLSTNELLASIPRMRAGLDDFIKMRIPHSRILAWISLTAFSVGLAAIGIWPDYLFPLLWVSPLLIIASLQAIRGEKTIFSGIAAGSWRNICLLALSALICGFFWELWNYRSFAKWIYAVPFVNRFKIFEMPILGYAGYLPFGLECAVVAEAFLAKRGTGQRCGSRVRAKGIGRDG